MIASVEPGWQIACARAELSDGILREVKLADGSLVLLAAAEGQVFACAADCPHQDTPLCEGILDGRTLTCPVHYWQWDISDGSPLGIAELPLKLFAVKEEAGTVLVKCE